MMVERRVDRIEGFVLAVLEPGRSARFYRDGLGFTDEGRDGEDARLSLGGVRLRLVRTDPGAAPRPPARADSADFQHFAIRVRDMAQAFRHLSAFDPAPISRGGPQRLPPANGSVTAWKFRDPDGHPLELLQPSAVSAPAGALFQAIDHTALACADPQASLGFYGSLGFSEGIESHNEGEPQDRLDGLERVNLRIATVYTAGSGPHVELLNYDGRSPTPERATPVSGAFITTCFSGARPHSLRDPDGHALNIQPTLNK